MNAWKKMGGSSLVWLLTSLNIFGQSAGERIPQLESKDGRHTFLVDGQPYFIFGAQAHNSSGWPAMLPPLWSAVEMIHANTLEVPIYWEQIQPAPENFDFSLIDTLLRQAREHQVRLILLWFATWKNGSNHYMPVWMKRDAGQYPNIMDKTGKAIDSPSPHAEVMMKADIKAFATVMKYLRKTDEQHTVIMVQVENESGAWGSVRDYSPAAQKLFDGPVPSKLLEPAILKALHVPVPSTGSWEKVFADRADEYFQAWSVASYVGQVAAAGKAEYPLLLYVNTALRDPLSNPPASTYESGGPTDNVIPIWKAAAPAIDLLAPDIYLSGREKIMKVIDLYDRPDNALFVPELGWSPERVKYLYEVIARGGIGFAPFGIDDNGRGSSPVEITEHLAPFAREYAVLAPMMRILAKWGSEGRIKTAIESEDHADQSIDLGTWKAVVSFGSGERKASEKINVLADGKLMIVRLDDNRFVLIGTRCHVTFQPSGPNTGRPWQYLKVEEGSYAEDVFKPLRILNGDETDWGGPRLGDFPTVLRTELILR